MTSDTSAGSNRSGESRSAGTVRGEGPATIYLLADHLDAVLASGEDLIKLSTERDAATRTDGGNPVWQNLHALVSSAGDLELGILARTLQARNLARDLRAYDQDIAPLLAVFSASTLVLADAAAELSDSTVADFDGGIDPLAYLRSRGVIAADAGTVDGSGTISIGEDFLIARRIALGPLMDLTAQLLDVLEAHYGLFADDYSAAAARPELPRDPEVSAPQVCNQV